MASAVAVQAPSYQEVALTAATNPLDDPFARLGLALERTLYFATLPGSVRVNQLPSAPTSPVDSAFDIGEGLGASGIRLATALILGPTRLAALLQSGPAGLAAFIENTVDAPHYIADPAIFGFRDALPAGLQPGVDQLRFALYSITQALNEAILGNLAGLTQPAAVQRVSAVAPPGGGPDGPGSPSAVDSNDPLVRFGQVIANTLEEYARPGVIGYQDYTPTTGPVDSAADIIEGLGASGLRLIATFIVTAQRVAALPASGPDGLRDLIENLVDGPLWVADPAIFGLRDALPSGLAPGITNVRNTVQGATDQINNAVLPNVPDVPSAQAPSTTTTTLVADKEAPEAKPDTEIKTETPKTLKTPTKKPEFNVVRDNPISGALKGVHDGLAQVGKNLQKAFDPKTEEEPKTATAPTPSDESNDQKPTKNENESAE
jgi:hypothetical protein